MAPAIKSREKCLAFGKKFVRIYISLNHWKTLNRAIVFSVLLHTVYTSLIPKRLEVAQYNDINVQYVSVVASPIRILLHGTMQVIRYSKLSIKNGGVEGAAILRHSSTRDV
jgi:hypothetical protein